jgi:hypothetical protein
MTDRSGPYRRDNNSTNYVHPNEENLFNLHKAMDYNAVGQPILRVAGSEVFGSINIALGNVDGMTQVFRHGYNNNFANGAEESYWDGSNLYPWSAWDSGADTLSIVSTGADNGTVTIVGLDANYNLQTDTVTLTNTTPVVTTTEWIRVYDLFFTDGAVNVGTITATANSTVIAQINPGFGNSQSGQYTVPAGYTAFLFHGQANIGKGNDGLGKFKYRLFGGTFYTGVVFMLYESVFDYKFTTPFVLPEKTDLDVTLVASNNGTQSSCAYDLILVDNDNLPS